MPWQTTWLAFTPTFAGKVGVLADDLSMLLVMVVTGVSLLVHIYSTGYLHGEGGYSRYFAALNLFTCSMLGLVLSISILQIYVFWELVGVSSFLLIGYYWEKPSAVAACKKAFIVTRFADLGFLLGLLVLSAYAGGLDFAHLSDPATIARLEGVTLLGTSALTLSAVLVYMGAAGKSAMFPLHIWLPDAMEGPTPVSALIHAATMVVAGVYLVARLFPLFSATEAGMTVVMVVGTFTSLFAAVIAVTQFDIKRVLAFSTLSQLGYMMLALGVARMEHPLGFTASLFHLATHACFKALLFLGAGSVIHAVHTNDIREMGGLRRKMPITHATFLIACLAIAGVPGFSGFFSKDEILAAALHGGHPVVFGVALLVAGLTAFYMFRIYFMTFTGEPRDHHKFDHAHESPPSMWVPLAILAVPSVFLGFVPFGKLRLPRRARARRHRLRRRDTRDPRRPGRDRAARPALRTQERRPGARSPPASASSTGPSPRSSTSTRSTCSSPTRSSSASSARRSPGSTAASWTAPWTSRRRPPDSAAPGCGAWRAGACRPR